MDKHREKAFAIAYDLGEDVPLHIAQKYLTQVIATALAEAHAEGVREGENSGLEKAVRAAEATAKMYSEEIWVYAPEHEAGALQAADDIRALMKDAPEGK